MKNILLKTLFLSFILTGVSCSPVSIKPSTDVKVTGVHLDIHELNIYVGASYDFTVTVEPYTATNKSVTWTLSDESVGEFSQNTFNALKAGDTTITVTTKDGGFTDTCDVQVKNVPDKVIDHVTATSSVLIYNLGDTFDRNTVSFTLYFTDDYYAPEELTNPYFEIQYQDFSTPGEKLINGRVQVGDQFFEFEFTVTVLDNGGGQTTLSFTVNAFNDFHGSIVEDGNQMGLAKLGTYLKEQSKKPNTLSLSQGDDWQGSIYSNYNRGRLVNDVYAYARLSARTVGNHDFDWGVEPLEDNTAASYDGYTTPVLAANVYDYDFSTKTAGNTQQSSIGVPTVTYTLDNGLKVGIVGVIGEDQITSITSSYTEEICFKPHIPIIKQYATALRQQGCSVVIASCHTGQADVLENGLEDYVDLVLCGHTHYNESTVENGLHYYQFACYGEYIGQIEMEYNVSTHKVSVTNTTTIDADTVDNYYDRLDSNITNLISTYEAQCNSEASEIVASNVKGTFSYKYNLVNLMCKAIYEQTVAEGHRDVLLAYCNNARATLYSGSWTYSDIYRAFPFDNVVYIESIKGSDILYEVCNYNCAYFNPDLGTGQIQINPNQYYKIAVLDYLLYHTSNKRYYDYFSSFDGHPDAYLSMNYRLILRKWLKDNRYNTGVNLSTNDYSSSNYQFDTSRLVSA